MTLFRPCIDLHQGRVKQIVGGTLADSGPGPKENFVAEQSSAWFARKYRGDSLMGGHVIKLGSGNDDAARQALQAYPGGMQIGGGINAQNATDWINHGASHVIVTSWLFDRDGKFGFERLQKLSRAIGANRLVIDLSCRRVADGNRPRWRVAMNRWQTLTDLEITAETLDQFADWSSELLIHAADVEGLCRGIDADLVLEMGRWGKLPMTYAGGVATLNDVQLVHQASGGRVDVTVGSALDLFGGTGVKYHDLVKWNQERI
ncbi:MAG: phosphoribosylformimino-5-aminoimidazole carboxamide ribotide isomerase [Planctomycetaceae bacterium]|nr:phosphoribosylformimino-5-aminoimidazole carboxamide ribotide isomerase [Planctomycetaceae bacterium]